MHEGNRVIINVDNMPPGPSYRLLLRGKMGHDLPPFPFTITARRPC